MPLRVLALTLLLPIVPGAEPIARHAPTRGNRILNGHSHVDHPLDAPAIALGSGAEILGSESTAKVLRYKISRASLQRIA